MAVKDTENDGGFGEAFSQASGGSGEQTGSMNANPSEGGTGEGAGTGQETGTGNNEANGTGTGTNDGSMTPEATGTAATTQDKNEQRIKSWEGRLKAEENRIKERMAELERREKELSAREASTKLNTNVSDNQTAVSTGEEDGDASFEAAKQKVVEDFGDDFALTLETLIDGLIKRKMGEKDSHGELESLKTKIDQVIDGFTDQLTKLHRNAIADAHEDFESIIMSPEFQDWCASHPKKDQIDKICQSGTAGQIIKMLNEFKKSKQVQNAPDAIDDAAHGVASGTVIVLPESTGKAGSFNDAFSEAAARK